MNLVSTRTALSSSVTRGERRAVWVARAFAAILAIILGASPASVHAQFLLINDCNGFTRAAENVTGKPQRVQFDVSSAQGNVSNARISLTNDITGEVRFAAAKGGNVTFFDVLPGVYTVATEEQGLTIGAIKFTPMYLLGGPLSTVVGGLVVGGGVAGGIIGVNAIADATDGNPGAEPTPEPTPTPAPTDDCTACNPDEEPPPLDEGAFNEVDDNSFATAKILSPSN